MTAILAMFANDGHTADEALVTRMLARMGSRGGARASVWREGGVVIAISRHEWEFGPGFSGPVLIVQDGDHVIAADASLYYRDDLRRKLAAKGVRPKGQTPSHLILAAYQAFGEKCPEMLEGDFSFVIWDRKVRRVIAARDFMGRRPVFFADLGSTFVIASTIGAILEHPLSSHDLNLASVVESMAGYVSSNPVTCYKSVSHLHAGRTLVREGRAPVRTIQHWEAPTFHFGSSGTFDDAAEQLKELLCAATAERLSQAGSTAVWMSGGRDSTAVFAAGKDFLRKSTLGGDLRPVSISYPVGDSGREDEAIQAVATHWKSSVQWLNITDIPLLDMPLERAAQRDEPLVHIFENVYRALAVATNKVDAHVALDGVGGDQLFLRSHIQFADLLRTGDFSGLAREWKAAGFEKSGFTTFFQWAVQPVLPTSMLLGAARFRHGRPLQAWLRRRVPEWISADFIAESGVPEYDRVLSPRRRGEAVGSTESRWYFTDPFFTTVFRLGADCALEHGVEIRSPLYDARIIDFAATRPISDHFGGTDGKRLLRHAMRDLLPAEIIAPRAERTGTPQDYAGGALRQALAPASSEQSQYSALQSLGLINIPAFEHARMKFLRYGSVSLRLPLLLTLHTEMWLRAHAIAEGSLGYPDAAEKQEMFADTETTSASPAFDATEDSTPLFL
jgi:asparagine synthase (glutamine-hydrolysing)